MPLSDYVNFRTLGNYIIHLESNNHLTKKEGLDSCYVFCPPSSMANTTPSLPSSTSHTPPILSHTSLIPIYYYNISLNTWSYLLINIL